MTLEQRLEADEHLEEKDFKEVQVGIKYEFLIAYKSDGLIIGVYREKFKE